MRSSGGAPRRLTAAIALIAAMALEQRSGLTVASLRTILKVTGGITSRVFIKKAGLETLANELSKHAQLIYLEDVRKTVDIGDKIIALMKGFMPRMFAAKGTPDDTGVILFTSGSYGTPKGAVLSHANIVANVEQAHAHIPFDPNWSFFCPLPMFHSFGLTGGVMLPIFTGHKTFLFPSPLQVKEIPKLIKETGANVFFGVRYAPK